MGNINIYATPLPKGLEKTALTWNQVRKGLGAAKGALIGHSDDALRHRGKLDDVRQWVTRSGFSNTNWNNAVNVGSKVTDDAGRLVNPKVIPGTKLVQGGSTTPAIDPDKLINKWWNPFGQYIGGEEGLNVLKSRYAQGGLFGKGGLAHGTFAYNPRLGYHAKDLVQGKRLMPSMGHGKWYKPWQWDPGSVIGTGYRGGLEVAKKGIGLGVPAAAAYGAFNPAEGDPRSLGQRVGGALGSTIGTYASWPMGYASWLPSTAASLALGDTKLTRALERATPWGLGEYAGEVAGSLGNRKEVNQYVTVPQAPQPMRMRTGPYGTRVGMGVQRQQRLSPQQHGPRQVRRRPTYYVGRAPYQQNYNQLGSSRLPYSSGQITTYNYRDPRRRPSPSYIPQLPQGLLYNRN